MNDNRGHSFMVENHEKFKQIYISYNKKNVVRGIHISPYGKLLTVLTGSITDYVVNMETLTYEKRELNMSNKVYIPPNHGHLFVSLEENTTLLYQFEGFYEKEKEVSVNYLDPFINLDLLRCNSYIISEKDTHSNFIKQVDYALVGSNGFLGSITMNFLEQNNKNFVVINDRLDNYEIIKGKLLLYKPKYVICAAGISGKPTVEWCETNKYQTYKTNVLDTLNLIEICKDLNIHITVYGSGGIFNGDGLREYTETDVPNNFNKIYSRYRIILEECIANYENVLYLRIQYPITGDGHKKCFMTKMLNRKNNVHDVPVNVTHMPTMLPMMIEMIERCTTGIFNFVNPGHVHLSNLIKMYDNQLEIKVVDEQINYFGLLNTTKLKNITHGLSLIHVSNLFSCIE